MLTPEDELQNNYILGVLWLIVYHVALCLIGPLRDLAQVWGVVMFSLAVYCLLSVVVYCLLSVVVYFRLFVVVYCLLSVVVYSLLKDKNGTV